MMLRRRATKQVTNGIQTSGSTSGLDEHKWRLTYCTLVLHTRTVSQSLIESLFPEPCEGLCAEVLNQATSPEQCVRDNDLKLFASRSTFCMPEHLIKAHELGVV